MTHASRIDLKPAAYGIGPSPRAALWTGGIGLVVAILLGVILRAVGNAPVGIDSWWHDLMAAGRTGFGLSLGFGFQFIGNVIPMIILGLVLTGGFLLRRRPWSAVTVASAMLGAEIVAAILKVSIGRLRPLDSLSDLGHTSYPSGHTTIAAAVTVVLALLIRRWWMWIAGACWVVAIAWSRTYIEAHWLTDVVGGAILGASAALLAWGVWYLIAHTVQARRQVARAGDLAAH